MNWRNNWFERKYRKEFPPNGHYHYSQGGVDRFCREDHYGFWDIYGGWVYLLFWILFIGIGIWAS